MCVCVRVCVCVQGLAFMEKFRGTCDRLTFTVAPHAPYTVDDAAFERVRKLSEEMGLRVHTHLHETEGECVDSAEGVDSMVRHKSEHLCRPFEVCVCLCVSVCVSVCVCVCVYLCVSVSVSVIFFGTLRRRARRTLTAWAWLTIASSRST